jgi:hypothetical protein
MLMLDSRGHTTVPLLYLLTLCFDCATVLSAAAADLPATTAELHALGAVLQDLEPSVDLPGVLTLEAAVQRTETHAAALAASLQERHQQQQQRQRTSTNTGVAIRRVPSTAAAPVLVACEPLDTLVHIMAFLPDREWLYFAPASRALRAAYIIAVHQPLWRNGAALIFKTRCSAAVTSEARLDEALIAGTLTCQTGCQSGRCSALQAAAALGR